MKKHLLALMMLLNAAGLFAQNPLEKVVKVNLGLQGIDFSYELPIAKDIIWESAIGAGVSMNVYDNKTEYTFIFLKPTPSIATGVKWMYNRDKRVAKEKETLNNTGNYLGIQTKYTLGNYNRLDVNNVLLTDIHWGLQRNLSSKFILNANIGLGYMHDLDTYDGGLAPVLRVKFGYRLF